MDSPQEMAFTVSNVRGDLEVLSYLLDAFAFGSEEVNGRQLDRESLFVLAARVLREDGAKLAAVHNELDLLDFVESED